jgi:hypothetical protein
VPPIPSLQGSAVPPIPALAGAGPTFEEKPRRWPVVLGLLFVLLAVSGAALWVFRAPLRALLKI